MEYNFKEIILINKFTRNKILLYKIRFYYKNFYKIINFKFQILNDEDCF